jgi:hypothetical protein
VCQLLRESVNVCVKSKANVCVHILFESTCCLRAKLIVCVCAWSKANVCVHILFESKENYLCCV